MSTTELTRSAHRSVSRLARSFQQLMRRQMACGPVTVQQCYTLAALADGPRTMKALAAEVGLHQSTLTRVVEKLERQAFVQRQRGGEDQRSVRVVLSAAGRRLHDSLEKESLRTVSAILDRIAANDQPEVVRALELLATSLDPEGEDFRSLLSGCCEGATQ